MDNNELMQKIEDLERENRQLQRDIEMFCDADLKYDEVVDIQQKALEMADQLSESAESFDTYLYNKESELAKREKRIEEEEKRLKALSAQCENVKKNLNAQIKKKAEPSIQAYKSKMLKIILGISAFYITTLVVIYLRMSGM